MLENRIRQFKYHESRIYARSKALLTLYVGCAFFASMGAVFLWSAVYLGGFGWLGGYLVGWVALCVMVGLLLWRFRPKEFYLAIGFTSDIHSRWRNACNAVGLTAHDKDFAYVMPSLQHIEGGYNRWSAYVNLRGRWHMSDVQKCLDDMSAAAGYTLEVSMQEGGVVRVTGARVYVESVSMVPITEPVAVVPSVPVHPVERMKAVPIAALQGENKVYELPLLDGHVLVAGMSRAGKAGYVWSTVIGLTDPIAKGYVKLWGLDPKGVELSICGGWWEHYDFEAADMVALLEQAVQGMHERKVAMQGRMRKFRPSRDMPLNLIIIDELAYVTSMLPTDKEKGQLSLQQRADRALNEILTQGAGLGYILFGAVQDPRKETVPSRDLWSTVIGLRLRAGMVNMLLGPDARNDGANCHLIPPMSRGGAGYGYVDVDGKYRFIYARWYEDDEIRDAYEYMLSLRSAYSIEEENAVEKATEPLALLPPNEVQEA